MRKKNTFVNINFASDYPIYLSVIFKNYDLSIIRAQMKVFTLNLIFFPFLIEISYYPVLRLVKNNRATGSIVIKRYTIPTTQLKIALF